MAIYDAKDVYPSQLGERDIGIARGEQDAQVAHSPSLDLEHLERIWPDVVKRLPSQIDILFLADSSLGPLAQKIRALPAYLSTKLALDLTSCAQDIDQAQQADMVFASSHKLKDYLFARTGKQAHLIRDGVRNFEPESFFINKWRHRLPNLSWALNLLPQQDEKAYEQTVSSFGGALGCMPIDTRMVFLGGSAYALTKQWRDCPFGELNMSRLQALGVLSEKDELAINHLAPVYALSNFSGDEHYAMTAQALYSNARVVAYAQALSGFESFLGNERIQVVEDVAQFHKALRAALTAPITSSLAQSEGGDVNLKNSLTARHTFAKVAPMLDSLVSPS
jgi:hypothetical protein